MKKTKSKRKNKKLSKGGNNNCKNMSPCLIGFKNRLKNIYNENDFETLLKNNKSEFSNISGSEPPYEPHKWNDNNIQINHNCYAYALNQRVGNRYGKPQPGYFANYGPIKDSEYNNCSNFYNRLKKDNPSMYLTSFDKPCRKGFYKSFIAIANNGDDKDYHFYRQDKNKYWSHKPGRTKVTNLDADKKLIKNPYLANRNYGHLNYSKPCFFFCNSHKMSKTASVIK